MAVLSSVPGRPGRGRVLRIAVAAGCALAAAAAGPGAAGAARVSATARWAGPFSIPGTATAASPALAAYHGQLYAAWTALSSPNQIEYSAFDNTTRMWSAPTAVPGAEADPGTGPALAVYHGDLYLAWEGRSPTTAYQHIWYSAFNGTSWTAHAEVPGALTTVSLDGSVGLAAYDGDLYLAWVGASVGSLWDSAFNGTSWTAHTKVPGTTGLCSFLDSVALASYRHRLYLAWEACNSSDIATEMAYATFDGTSWSPPAASGPRPNFGPVLAVKGTTLYESWVTPPASTVDWASFNGTTWTSAKAIPGSGITNGMTPAIASYDGVLYDAWVDESYLGPIDYSERS